MSDNNYMPVHSSDNRIPNCPHQIPMSLLNEKRAYSNHGQTLEKLKQRGGLGIKEMLAVINDRPWAYYSDMPMPFAIAALNQILNQHTK